MNKNKLTVTIGIPAYNEEANIKYLLDALLNQKTKDINLERIIVLSDGSTDQTNQLVQSVRDSRIKLLTNPKRLGLNESQNRILKASTSDILVLLDADVLPKDDNFLIKITEPIRDKKADLVSCKLHSLRVSSFYGRIITNSNELKRDIYQHLDNPHNIYLCNGNQRAFSKRLYQEIKWPEDIPEDAYSYLYAISHGFTFRYTNEAIILFHPPSNFQDHLRQHRRFISGKIALKKYFTKELLDEEYFIPRSLLFKMIIEYAHKRPLSIPLYLFIMFIMKFTKTSNSSDQSKYEIAKSSKRIVYGKN